MEHPLEHFTQNPHQLGVYTTVTAVLNKFINTQEETYNSLTCNSDRSRFHSEDKLSLFPLADSVINN